MSAHRTRRKQKKRGKLTTTTTKTFGQKEKNFGRLRISGRGFKKKKIKTENDEEKTQV